MCLAVYGQQYKQVGAHDGERLSANLAGLLTDVLR